MGWSIFKCSGRGTNDAMAGIPLCQFVYIPMWFVVVRADRPYRVCHVLHMPKAYQPVKKLGCVSKKECYAH